MTTTLVLGGARSGKSAWAQTRAERRAEASGVRPVMIVTAQALDDEMRERIDRHRADRGARWTTVEAPLDVAGSLATLGADDVAVIDCLTLWLGNQMGAEADIEALSAALVQAVAACPATLFVVSNEVGWGIVPDNALARRFRDHAGRLHQGVAAVADQTVLVMAGQSLILSR